MSEPRRPRLLVLASTYPRWHGDPEPGFVHELARRLVDRFEVSVVCPHAPGAALRECMDGVDVHRYRYAPGRFEALVNDGGITTNLGRSRWKYLLVAPFLIGMFFSAVFVLRRYRPDVVHAHWLVPQGLVATLLLRGKVPIVATSHGADLYAWKSGLFERLKRFVVRRADAITVVSRPMVAELLRLGADAATVSVAPMGVDFCERFTPSTLVQRSPHEILFVGRLVEKKGLRHLIDAMPAILESIPEATLTIAGFGPELADLERQADDAGVSAAIAFIGAVPQEELPMLYRRAAVFVAPFVESATGDREGLGLVALEAAGCGCPVVVSDMPVVRDVFGPGDAAFARPADPGDIARQVVAVLCGGRELPDSLGERLARKFDWGAVAGKYAAILSRAMAGRGAG